MEPPELSRDDDVFRLALDLSPAAMVVVDQRGCVVLVNRETERLFGYDRGELIGQDIEQLVPARFRASHSGHRTAFVGAPEARPMGKGRDLYGLRKDGTEVPVEIGLNPVRTQHGHLVVASIFDLGERKRAEARFQAAVESSPSGVLMVDAAGLIVLANREAERTFGYGSDELLGRPVEQLVPHRFGARHPGYRDEYLAAPESRRMGAGRELFGVRKDGSEVPLELGLTPITTEEGIFALASVVDISLRRTLENQLQEAQRLEIVGALASGVAHDFNNVLLAILGYSDLVLDDPGLASHHRRDLEQVVKAADRGRQVVEQMLQVGRRRPSQAQATLLHDPVNEAVDLLQASVLKAAEIRRHIDEAAPAVWCDGTQIHQIVMNLGSNAARAMAGSGMVDVSLVPFHADARAVQRHPGLQLGLYSRLTITDNGSGMQPELAERVFEPFFTSGQGEQGTGLGLWLVRETVQNLHGVIELKSRPGEGTTFDIFLPATDASARPAGDPAAEPAADARTHIVYVEDEEPLAELGRRRLEAVGYRVTVYTSSVHALEALQRDPTRFDLLVTDNTMPRLSGLELAEQAVRLRPGLPVLMVSGLAQIRLEDVPAFVTRVLPKPHSGDQLITSVRELMDRS